ncbi:MAG: hypothetical protein FWE38_05365 [Firmicutes bacterium]|nr:hypothetical protein [Bacillota bacterium]
MKILIANYLGKGTQEVSALYDALSKNHDVTIAAMASEASYLAQSFQFANEPTRVEDLGKRVYEFYSNPADMVSIMLGQIMRHDMPDLVICGISNGTNMGPDLYTSSNVGMAMEAAYFGVPAIVISTEFQSGTDKGAYKNIAKFVEKNIAKFAEPGLPPHTFLNIAVPRVEKYSELKGVSYTRMGRMNLQIEFIEGKDPKGGTYYWSKKSTRKNLSTEGEDEKRLFDMGFVVVTPINYDATDYLAIAEWGAITKRITRGEDA